MAKIEPISHLEKIIVNCFSGGTSGGTSGSTNDKEFRFVNLSDYKNNTDFIADADGNYTYNLNNKTITNIKFTGNFFANMGTLTFVGKSNFVLKQGSGITQGTELKDTNFTGLTLTKGTNGLTMNGNMILTLE